MKGKIYRIYWPDGRFYIGSTIQVLKYRLNKHKHYNQLCISSTDWSEAKIECLEEIECETLQDLHYLERVYLETCKDEYCLNTLMPYLTDDEKEIQKILCRKRWRKINRDYESTMDLARYHRHKNTES
jgi:hypothetical protein